MSATHRSHRSASGGSVGGGSPRPVVIHDALVATSPHRVTHDGDGRRYPSPACSAYANQCQAPDDRARSHPCHSGSNPTTATVGVR